MTTEASGNYHFDDPRFTYGNWNEAHLYFCVKCNDEDNRLQPPVGVIELLDEDGSPTGDFQSLCWRHMHAEAEAWVAFLSRNDLRCWQCSNPIVVDPNNVWVHRLTKSAECSTRFYAAPAKD